MPWLIILLAITTVNAAEIGDPYKCWKEAGEIPYPDTDKPKECFFKPPLEKFAKAIVRPSPEYPEWGAEVYSFVGRQVCANYNARLPQLTDGPRLLYFGEKIKNEGKHGIPLGVRGWAQKIYAIPNREEIRIVWENGQLTDWQDHLNLYGSGKTWTGGNMLASYVPILIASQGDIVHQEVENFAIKVFPLMWYCHRELKEPPPPGQFADKSPSNEATRSSAVPFVTWFMLWIGLKKILWN